jgi:4-hydroxy-3-polyprenylbenzoate decarboxylase
MADPIAVGMTGASGQLYGVAALSLLADTDHEVHLVLSEAAKTNVDQETDRSVEDVLALADVQHSNDDVGAEIASGSFDSEGMLLAPCSMKTLSDVARGRSGNLVTRAADVTLKERRPLVVMPREMPYNRIHIENMLSVTDAGGVVFPPSPSFYQRPDSIEELVSRTAARALSHVGVDVPFERWDGLDDG